MSTAARAGNAFVLTLRMTLRAMPGVEGRAELGPYQGDPQGPGYRLVHVNDAGAGVPSFLLERRDAGGAGVLLDAYNGPLEVADGREREIRWLRDSKGLMTVSIDGEEILAARDGALAGGFDGVVLVNTGGDVEVGALEIEDAN
jgi:hypothetical protein